MPSSFELLGISYGLGLWQSYVAQLRPRLRSGRVSSAAHRGVRQMPSSFELLGISCGLGLWQSYLAQLTASASLGQGFMRRLSWGASDVQQL